MAKRNTKSDRRPGAVGTAEKSPQVSWRRRMRIDLTGFIHNSIAFGQENENPNTK